MKTITFYSFRGGVGRSLAAASFAVYLARLGLKTIIIDLNLEAPGLDAKLGVKIEAEQLGMIDYALLTQGGTPPENAKPYLVKVPIEDLSSSNESTLWLLPAGDWSSDNYHSNLTRLNWNSFLRGTESEAMFRRLLDQLRSLSPSYVIIDSRTGLGEATGAFTLVLADEVAIFSTYSESNLKTINRLVEIIRRDAAPKEGGSTVAVAVVFSKLSMDEDIKGPRSWASRLQDPEHGGPNSAFFITSSGAPWNEDKLPLYELSDNRDVERLVSDYVSLFTGLEPNLKEVISEKLHSITDRAMGESNKDADATVSKFVGLVPHPEVYRWAMRYFDKRDDLPKVRDYAISIITMKPKDAEALRQLAHIYRTNKEVFKEGKVAAMGWRNVAISTFRRLGESNKLDAGSQLELASLLKEENELPEAYDLANSLLSSPKLTDLEKYDAASIALLCALQLSDGERRVREFLADNLNLIQHLSVETSLWLVVWCLGKNRDSTSRDLGLRLAEAGELDPFTEHIKPFQMESLVIALTNLAKDQGWKPSLEEATIKGMVAKYRRGKISAEQKEQSVNFYRRVGLSQTADRLKESL